MSADKKTYHHGDLKNALIVAGIEILEADGLPGLTLRAIAASTGVSHTAPKNHFGNLRGLLTAIATEGFHRHAAFMRAGLGNAATREDKLAAAISGYVRFAVAHPHLFALMFSPMHCNMEDAELRSAGGASYSILQEISKGLDWDKAKLPGGQVRTEIMLWSFVHGYATLALSGQLKDDTTGGLFFDIAEIMPTFRYISEH
jgi:AcrR family transcriptional regulator